MATDYIESAGVKDIGGAVYLTSFDQTAQTLSIIFDFVAMFGKAMRLAQGDKMIVRLNDNFTFRMRFINANRKTRQ